MSITVVATVIYGCRLAELAEWYVEVTDVQKFDEDTGEPILKQVKKEGYRLKTSPGVKFPDVGELCQWLEYDTGGQKPRLAVGQSAGYEEDLQSVVAGCKLAERDPYDCDPTALAEPDVEVIGWLSAYGVHAQGLKTFLVLYLG